MIMMIMMVVVVIIVIMIIGCECILGTVLGESEGRKRGKEKDTGGEENGSTLHIYI
jgi:hypothetical protein